MRRETDRDRPRLGVNIIKGLGEMRVYLIGHLGERRVREDEMLGAAVRWIERLQAWWPKRRRRVNGKMR